MTFIPLDDPKLADKIAHSYYPRAPIWRAQRITKKLWIAIIGALCFIVFFARSPGQLSSVAIVRETPSKAFKNLPASQRNSKYAYVTFLTENDYEEKKKDVVEDVYLTCVRMILYQLLHDPQTRTEENIPVVVLVNPDVTQEHREILVSEGASIVEYPSVNIDWIKPGRARWKHNMDKLNALQLVQYEKILLFDSDVVIFKRLDRLFHEPETEIQTNLNNPANIRSDEAKQPQKYLMAADTGPVGGEKHEYPAPRNGVLNAGFVMLHPSMDVFNHYISVASIEGRTAGAALENNLWEYVHRSDGNMPFSKIKPTWIMNHAVYNDWESGIAAVYEKWFRNSLSDKKLRDVLLAARWRMDGFWSGKYRFQTS